MKKVIRGTSETLKSDPNEMKKVMLNDKSFITAVDSEVKPLYRSVVLRPGFSKENEIKLPGRLRNIQKLVDLEDTTLENEILDTMKNGSKRLKNLMLNVSLDTNGWRYFKSKNDNQLLLLKEQCDQIEQRKELVAKEQSRSR